jgi:hypothetical protein
MEAPARSCRDARIEAACGPSMDSFISSKATVGLDAAIWVFPSEWSSKHNGVWAMGGAQIPPNGDGVSEIWGELLGGKDGNCLAGYSSDCNCIHCANYLALSIRCLKCPLSSCEGKRLQ